MADGTVHTGERYAKSPMTGTYYRVTKWEQREGAEDGHIVALEKEEVDRAKVPAPWLNALEERDE